MPYPGDIGYAGSGARRQNCLQGSVGSASEKQGF